MSAEYRTQAGKDRSKLNATRHGERGARRRAFRRAMNDFLRLMQDEDWRGAAALAGVDPTDVWIGRINDELDQ